jgi:hypothetical protein
MTWSLCTQDTAGGNLNIRLLVAYGATSGQQIRRISRTKDASVSISRLQINNVTTTVHLDTANDFSGVCAIAAIYTATDNGGRINGVKTTPVSTAHGGTLSTTATQITLGGSNAAAPTSFWLGKCRHLMFTDVLSDADSEKLEAWLLWDVGQQANLVVGHPYRSIAP